VYSTLSGRQIITVCYEVIVRDFNSDVTGNVLHFMESTEVTCQYNTVIMEFLER
jgi:hypothetical protein